jgi:uncharacterized RDD family membrane protein YckC
MNTFNGETSIQMKKASAGSRTAAFWIDYTIFLLGLVIALGIAYLVTQRIFDSPPVWIFVIIFALAFVEFYLRDILGGQSIGKRVMGICIRNAENDAEVPSVGKLFLRNLISPLWPLEFLVIIIRSDSRKIGDMIAGTAVYNLSEYEKNKKLAEHWEAVKNSQGATIPPPVIKNNAGKVAAIAISTIMSFALFVGVLIFFAGAIMTNSPAYMRAIQAINESPEVYAQVGEIQSFGRMPSGSIQTTGASGSAQFNIRVNGERGTTRVFVELEMFARHWEIVRMYVRN